ncbi:DUF6234 family protein [Streptomyces sp. NPDC046215]|uniref:DUF6234 domain-containing protein n=1 Tax=Streptomyces stramineus TaxID=173861 RepID=A0ABN0ZDJ7_9ACTN
MERKRESGGTDFLFAVLLIVLDVMVTALAFLMALGQTEYPLFSGRQDSAPDMTPLVSTMAILGIVIALSAWPLLRGRLPACGWLQILFGGALCCLTLYGAIQNGG